MLAQWLVNISYSGSVADYVTLPEQYLWAKIAVAAGAPLPEANYISLPKQYVWKAIYDAVSGSSLGTIDWVEKQALGHIAAAYRGDTANPANLATYINWPWRYQVASIIDATSLDSDARAFIELSGATDEASIDAFVKGVKDLGLWESMVAWPLRSSQNAGTGTTAYSLGGLGTFNGTLTNGPTWGANGCPFTTTQYAHASITALPQDVTLLFCGAGDGSTHPSFPQFFGVQAGANWTNNQIAIGGNGGANDISTIHRNSTTAFGNPTANTTNPFNSATTFAFVSGTGKVADIINYRNVSAQTLVSGTPATAGTATLDRMQLNGRWAGALSLGAAFTCSFAAIVTPNINGSEASIYNLYKTTLGTGLGLP
jgi:hypothetical protein